jgi:aminoglycoside/choline kinase family phosphotransferase
MTTAFLQAAGFGAARLAPLPSDASARRYTRLQGGPRPALLMEAPPPENTRPFIAIARHIMGLGLSAPEIIAADPEGASPLAGAAPIFGPPIRFSSPTKA